MKYRVATNDDWPAINHLINKESPLTAEILADGGTWLVAEDDKGLAGCVWVLVSGRHGYVEYLVMRPDKRNGAGIRFALILATLLSASGVRYVRATTKNTAIARLFHNLGGYVGMNHAAVSVDLGD